MNTHPFPKCVILFTVKIDNEFSTTVTYCHILGQNKTSIVFVAGEFNCSTVQCFTRFCIRN